MLLLHPHRKQQTQAAVMRNRRSSEEERGSLVAIPYVAGMSEDIRCVCSEFSIRVVFKSTWTHRSMLTKVKDMSSVVYRIPCS